MTGLLLGEREQSAVRAVVGSEPVPGLPGNGVLDHVARLVACDAIGVVVLDGEGAVLQQTTPPRGWTLDDLPSGAGADGLGVERRGRGAPGPAAAGTRRAAVLWLAGRDDLGHVVVLWLVRRRSDFGERDEALLALVTPALLRLLREPPTPSLDGLTAQERRVLQHVAVGRSNAEIAERLVVAPSTVGKHLENVYRKLGVTNRLAAARALTTT